MGQSWGVRHYLIHLSLFIFGAVEILPSSRISAAELKVSPIYLHPITPGRSYARPQISMTQDRLLVGADPLGKVLIYPVEHPEQMDYVFSGEMHSSLSSSVTGWAATCFDAGKRLGVFDVRHIQKHAMSSTIDFQDEEKFKGEGYIDCGPASLDIEKADDLNHPSVVFTSIISRRLLKMDFNGKIQKRYPGIVRGPWALQFAAPNAFVVISSGRFLDAMPFVANMETQTSVVGNSEGDNASLNGELQTGYYNFANYYDHASDYVYYFRYTEKLLHRFSASHPTIDKSQKLKVNLESPLAMTRFGRCLAIMGHSPAKAALYDDWYPQWTIVRSSDENEFKELRNIEPLVDNQLVGAIYEQADSKGNVYVSSYSGVYQVSGLFEGLPCDWDN